MATRAATRAATVRRIPPRIVLLMSSRLPARTLCSGSGASIGDSTYFHDPHTLRHASGGGTPAPGGWRCPPAHRRPRQAEQTVTGAASAVVTSRSTQKGAAPAPARSPEGGSTADGRSAGREVGKLHMI